MQKVIEELCEFECKNCNTAFLLRVNKNNSNYNEILQTQQAKGVLNCPICNEPAKRQGFKNILLDIRCPTCEKEFCIKIRNEANSEKTTEINCPYCLKDIKFQTISP